MWLAIAYALWRFAERSRATGSRWIAAALAGALTSRFVEQLSGSPTAADVFTFWVLVGMLAAAVALGSPASTSIDEEVNAARRTTRSGYSKRRALVFPAVAIIVVLSFYMS